jgi:antitoxin component YwqK of YwqJK toxin-antitoxin module
MNSSYEMEKFTEIKRDNDDKPNKPNEPNEASVDFHLASVETESIGETILMMRTTNTRNVPNEEPLCAICYYNSEDDEDDQTQEKQISRKTLYDTNRYSQMYCLREDACEVCSHRFHTVCLYKWFKSSREFKCPLCRASPMIENDKLQSVPELFGSEPEYIVQYYPNGKVQTECYKENGIYHNFLKKYDLLGNITYECGYYKGDKHGQEIEYHIHTTKKWKLQEYRFGSKHGFYKEYSLESIGPNSEQVCLKSQQWANHMQHGVEEERFLATQSKKRYCEFYEGLKHGVEKIWTITGKMIFYKRYDHGRAQGRCIVRFPDNGCLERKCFYNTHGQLDGIYMEWQYACKSLTKGNTKNKATTQPGGGGGFSLLGMLTGGNLNLNAGDAEETKDDKYDVNHDVVLKIKSFHINGVTVGQYEEYHDNGILKKQSFYNQNGDLDEEYFEYDRFGRCILRYMYENGQLSGLCERYGDNGKIKETGYYVDGVLHGIDCYKQYYANGRIKAKQSYNQGELHGPSYYYTQKGSMAAKYEYINGSCPELSFV